MIDRRTVRRIREQCLLSNEFNDAQCALILGSVVTDPKAWLMPEPVPSVPPNGTVHGMARIAWYEDTEVRLVFANGVCRETSENGLVFVRNLCAERRASRVAIASISDSESGRDLLDWLRLHGVFDTHHTAE